MIRRRWWLDAIGAALIAVALWPELAQKRVWLWAGHRAARECARRCGQVALTLETAYARECA